MLAQSERLTLLEIARAAVAAHVAGRATPVVAADAALSRPAAVFVTLRRGRRLRGCVGSTSPRWPLAEAVRRCAIASATDDPRFDPIKADELPDLSVEISVLGGLEPIAGPDEIELGRHGLVVEQGPHNGLLLPQVATEWRWDRETFVGQTCVKAGLPSDAWRRGASLFRFTAEVFGDAETGDPCESIAN